MIRSSSNWAMDRNHPPHPSNHPDHVRYARGEGDGGGRGRSSAASDTDRWTRSSHPVPPSGHPGDDRRAPSLLPGPGWHQEPLAAAPAAPHEAFPPVHHPPRTRRLVQHRHDQDSGDPSTAPAAAAAPATTTSSESDREASPFPHHHDLAAEQLPFVELGIDPVAATSMDSSSPSTPEGDGDGDRKPAAVATAAPKTGNPRAPRGSTATRSGDASSGGLPFHETVGHEHRHSKRHSLSQDPFGGLSARLFPSDDPQELTHPGGIDDEDGVDDGMRGPDASFDHALQVPTFSHHGSSEFYASEGPLYDVHQSPIPSHSFAATPTSYAPYAPTFHHSYGSPQPAYHHHHLAHPGSPMPPPPVPPPQIYRLGYAYSAPPHYDPRHPPVVGFVESPPADDPAGYMYSDVPHRPFDVASVHRRGGGGGGDERFAAARTAPAAKSRPAKKSQPRKSPRPASRRSSSGSGSGSSAGGRSGTKARRSTPRAATATSAAAAGSSTRSGERTSQVRHSPTDEEIAEAKTPRARSALANWYKRLYDLIDYKNEHGDCNVPQKYPQNIALGVWVNKQRMEKKFMDEGKKSSMTVSKLRALEEVGFLWAKRKGQPSWDQRFSELVEYRNGHGDCNVPTKYGANPALGRWVSTQRSQYKLFRGGGKTQMTAERMNRLHAIGFRWAMTDGPIEGDGDEYYDGGGENNNDDDDDDDEYGGAGAIGGRRLFLSSGGSRRGDHGEMEV